MGQCTVFVAGTTSMMQSWTRSAEKLNSSWHTNSITVRDLRGERRSGGESKRKLGGGGGVFLDSPMVGTPTVQS